MDNESWMVYIWIINELELGFAFFIVAKHGFAIMAEEQLSRGLFGDKNKPISGR